MSSGGGMLEKGGGIPEEGGADNVFSDANEGKSKSVICPGRI